MTMTLDKRIAAIVIIVTLAGLATYHWCVSQSVFGDFTGALMRSYFFLAFTIAALLFYSSCLVWYFIRPSESSTGMLPIALALFMMVLVMGHTVTLGYQDVRDVHECISKPSSSVLCDILKDESTKS